ncbi:MAG: hypothetical protein KDI90_06900 [Alphaproteobacteria bacterium]|nr:hypothetical protein [Alphaproteobacteria bacterium]MCB9975150.1 hypothetical protein [Rhodospirillales bacterium]
MSVNNRDEDHELFERYLHICNQALCLNADRFPFKQILEAAGGHPAGGKPVEVLIVNDQPEEGICIRYNHEQRVVQSEERHEPTLPKRKWKITRSYLLEVIRNSGEYINNPAKIDWEWLYALGEADQLQQDEQFRS